jgi:hypothetical protein
MDTNSDGQLSKAEGKANAELKKAFKKLDTDNSGSLSAAEFASFELKADTDVKANPGTGSSNSPSDKGMGGSMGIGR